MIPPLLPLLATLLASPVTLNGTVIAEGRAGSSPVLAGQGSQEFAGGVLSPQLELWLRNERAEARLAYLPRLVWQIPNQLGYQARPLVLHQAGVALTARLSSTTDGSVSVFGSIGQPDYAILPQLLGSGQAALPQVQTVMAGRGNAVLQDRVTRRLRLTLGAGFSYFQVLNDPAPAGMAPPPVVPGQVAFDHQLAFTALPGATFAVTRTDNLVLTSGVSYGSYSNGITIASVGPQLMWRVRQLPAGDELRLAVGLSYARNWGSASTLGDGANFLPMGSVDLTRGLVMEDSRALRARVRLVLEQYVDPILAVSGPRATTSAELLLTLAPAWSFAVQGEFSASLRLEALENNPDETSFSLRVPIRHRFSSNVLLEWGGFWADRAPAFVASDFRFHQRQLWAYVALTLTTRDVSPWSIR